MFDNIDNIIFDLDGTLIDSSPGVIESTNYALQSLGEAPRRPDEITPFIGYPLEKMFASFCRAPMEKLKAAFQEKAREVMVASVRPLPGAGETLACLHRGGYRLAVATTKYTVHSTGIVDKCGWGKYLTALASGDEVARVKPAPDILTAALAKLNAGPERSVMVGDTVNDIIPAQALGMRVIAVKSPFGSDDLQAHNPDLYLERLVELTRIFKAKKG